jgi:hypothetical protein
MDAPTILGMLQQQVAPEVLEQLLPMLAEALGMELKPKVTAYNRHLFEQDEEGYEPEPEEELAAVPTDFDFWAVRLGYTVTHLHPPQETETTTEEPWPETA